MNNIKPQHYHADGKIDRFEVWYQTNDFQTFRGMMKSHIDKYVWRYDKKNGVEDLKKAIETTQRLIEYEEMENV